MTPEEAAARIIQGTEEEYVAALLEYVTSHLAELSDPSPDLLYRLRRLYDVMPADMVNIYLGYQQQILDEAETYISEAALDAGTERAMQAYTGHTPSMVYSYGYQRLHEATVEGCTEIINRYNVDLIDSMADAWYEASVKAVSQSLTYYKGPGQVIAEAVGSMRGITDITYKSGAKYPIDAAIRRHVVTQLNQNHQRLTEMRASEYGWDLFMCSSHSGCRPSHYDFQGQVFSKGDHIGEKIDGHRVRDYDEMEIGDVTGIYGANCQHYVTPYVPGYSEPQVPTETEAQNEERYELTQKQRARERSIRATKQEVFAAEQSGDPDAIAAARLKLGRQQAGIKKFCEEHDLPRRYDLEKAYGIGKQPRGLKGKAKATKTAASSKPKAAPKQTAQPFKAATSIEDALQFAHSQFGVDTMGTMYDKMGLEGANLINEGLYRVKQVLGDVNLRDIRYKATLADNPNTVAAYNPAWNGLFFSKRIKGKNALTNMGKMQAEQYDIGWWSSKNPLGTVYHEMGHYAHHVIDGHGSSTCSHYLDLLRERYRKEAAQGEDVDWSRWGREGTSLAVSTRARDNGLSGYALMNNNEMVAEAFAQLYDGNVSRQSREVLKTLLQYGSNIGRPENAGIKRTLEQL